jgi:hypothetical protein
MIENRSGNMLLENILGVPHPVGVDQRWVDNYSLLTCRNFRFGGEGGGFTPVYNFARYSPQAGGPKVIIEDSWVSAESSYKGHCAVYCVEVPNMVIVRNCNLTGVPPIKVDKKIDLKNYFRNVRPGMLQFQSDRNIGEFGDDVPELLTNPVIVEDEKAEPPQLSMEETRRLLAEAVEFQKKRTAPEESPAESHGHTQQTDPSKYIDITYDKYTWDLDAYMDATKNPNAEYIAIAPVGDDVIIMKRIQGYWPHVLIPGVEVDLDK